MSRFVAVNRLIFPKLSFWNDRFRTETDRLSFFLPSSPQANTHGASTSGVLVPPAEHLLTGTPEPTNQQKPRPKLLRLDLDAAADACNQKQWRAAAKLCLQKYAQNLRSGVNPFADAFPSRRNGRNGRYDVTGVITGTTTDGFWCSCDEDLNQRRAALRRLSGFVVEVAETKKRDSHSPRKSRETRKTADSNDSNDYATMVANDSPPLKQFTRPPLLILYPDAVSAACDTGGGDELIGIEKPRRYANAPSTDKAGRGSSPQKNGSFASPPNVIPFPAVPPGDSYDYVVPPTAHRALPIAVAFPGPFVPPGFVGAGFKMRSSQSSSQIWRGHTAAAAFVQTPVPANRGVSSLNPGGAHSLPFGFFGFFGSPGGFPLRQQGFQQGFRGVHKGFPSTPFHFPPQTVGFPAAARPAETAQRREFANQAWSGGSDGSLGGSDGSGGSGDTKVSSGDGYVARRVKGNGFEKESGVPTSRGVGTGSATKKRRACTDDGPKKRPRKKTTTRQIDDAADCLRLLSSRCA